MDSSSKIYELLERTSCQFSKNIAVVHNAESISYGQLSSLSDEICNKLKKLGIDQGDRVAILYPKSIVCIASIFGVLKSEAAYLPIDFNAPDERNNKIIADGSVSAVIIHKDKLNLFLEENYLLAEEIDESTLILKPKTINKIKSPNDLAYILYTSGSTGIPKGVMHTHASAINFLDWCSATFDPTEKDVFSSHAPFHFDLSILDLFLSIKHGAKLVLIDDKVAGNPIFLAKLISDEKISIWYSTPTILNLLSFYGKLNQYSFTNLRLVLFAGEIFPINHFEKLSEFWTKPVYYNLYGPTETNVCTYYKVDSDKKIDEIPIGKCCSHFESLVINVDESTDEGELCLKGEGLMSGYWNNPTSNETAFYTDDKNQKWYKTGDLVFLNEDNQFLFRGRKDRMIKRNGYRIELDEIEITLNKHPEIINNAVISKVDEEKNTIIICFIETMLNNEISVIEMKKYCVKNLPVYMIPTNFVFIEKIPTTSTNKVDYQKLEQLF